MDWLLIGLLFAAAMFALARGVGVSSPGGRADFGWLAVTCLIVALALLPAVWKLQATA